MRFSRDDNLMCRRISRIQSKKLLDYSQGLKSNFLTLSAYLILCVLIIFVIPRTTPRTEWQSLVSLPASWRARKGGATSLKLLLILLKLSYWITRRRSIIPTVMRSAQRWCQVYKVQQPTADPGLKVTVVQDVIFLIVHVHGNHIHALWSGSSSGLCDEEVDVGVKTVWVWCSEPLWLSITYVNKNK